MPKKDEPRMTYTEANENLHNHIEFRRMEIFSNDALIKEEKQMKMFTLREDERMFKQGIDIAFGY